MRRGTSGADVLCTSLKAAGVEFAFGLPATQTLALYEALRRSGIRAVVPTHELAAAFMASGYARASGKVGVLMTMPGPGFAYALAGIAEAKLDNTALLHVTLQPARSSTGAPGFQAIDQQAIARPLVKAILTVDDWATIPSAVANAMDLARSPMPGPVLLEIAFGALVGSGVPVPAAEASWAPPRQEDLEEVVALVAAARRPAIFVAGECIGAPPALRMVAERGRIPVCVPPPARGVLAEDHPWCLCFDEQRTAVETLNAMLRQSDLVLLLGTNLGHASTAGGQLALCRERLVCVSATSAGLGDGRGASRTIRVEPAALLERLAGTAEEFASEWSLSEMATLRGQFLRERPADPPEPVVDGGSPANFFKSLQSVLPRNAIVVTDSGLHQVLVRRHHQVFGTNGLIFPTDFQSMGFGLPAGIGAKLAAPGRPVIVVMGDGGFNMSGLEMLTAMKEGIQIIVVVLNDGQLNLIRLRQLREWGRSTAVSVRGPDLSQFAAALGVRYRRVSGDLISGVEAALESSRPTLIDVPVHDSLGIHGMQSKGAMREGVRRALGPELMGWLKHRLHRGMDAG